jgi:TPR repeat protein
VKAAEKNHPQALHYINKTTFPADVYLKIAKMYETGESVVKNITRALEFLLKASDASNAEASFKLGQWYESGSQPGVSKDVKKAAQYYLRAAKQSYPGALPALENVSQSLKDAQLEYEVGYIYHTINKNISTALSWYKKTADKAHQPALTQLQQLANQTPQHAYEIGLLYENSGPTTANLTQAIRYYMSAVKKEHAAAKNKVETLANSGNVDAQYALGFEYYHQQKNNFLEATKWCMKAAEKNHAQALQYLNTTAFSADVYYEIARRFEKGEGVAKNMARAMEFYTKASNAGHKAASMHLGNSYQIDQMGALANLENAWKGYLQAAKLGELSAIAPLERLTEELGAERQIELAAFYQTHQKNETKASYWYAKAAETGNAKAQQALNAIKAPTPVRTMAVPVTTGIKIGKKATPIGNTTQTFAKSPLPASASAPAPLSQNGFMEKRLLY